MIDIDASLQAMDSHPTFWVYFDDPGDETEHLGLEIRAEPRQQRRLIDKFVKISAMIDENKEKVSENEMQISSDWEGLAQALTGYIIGWEGFTGQFSQEMVKRWFKAYPSYASAFALSFKGVLDQYEQQMICRKAAELKN
jgi:uncharacterized protein YukE